jgi:hypothetical protein
MSQFMTCAASIGHVRESVVSRRQSECSHGQSRCGARLATRWDTQCHCARRATACCRNDGALPQPALHRGSALYSVACTVQQSRRRCSRSRRRRRVCARVCACVCARVHTHARVCARALLLRRRSSHGSPLGGRRARALSLPACIPWIEPVVLVAQVPWKYHRR